MNKTNEELQQLKQEYETIVSKLKDLSEDELKQISGGSSKDENESGAQIIHRKCF
ncbi:MAG: bacteriocin [Erysipelotrichaceae bacterium]|nr:bacteriocin [Erysipelotrichaceae bacterium]